VKAGLAGGGEMSILLVQSEPCLLSQLQFYCVAGIFSTGKKRSVNHIVAR